jgi:hypothetical protein
MIKIKLKLEKYNKEAFAEVRGMGTKASHGLCSVRGCQGQAAHMAKTRSGLRAYCEKCAKFPGPNSALSEKRGSRSLPITFTSGDELDESAKRELVMGIMPPIERGHALYSLARAKVMGIEIKICFVSEGFNIVINGEVIGSVTKVNGKFSFNY